MNAETPKITTGTLRDPKYNSMLPPDARNSLRIFPTVADLFIWLEEQFRSGQKATVVLQVQDENGVRKETYDVVQSD